MAVRTFPHLVQGLQFVYSFKSLVRTRRIIHEVLVPYIPEFQREREREYCNSCNVYPKILYTHAAGIIAHTYMHTWNNMCIAHQLERAKRKVKAINPYTCMYVLDMHMNGVWEKHTRVILHKHRS